MNTAACVLGVLTVLSSSLVEVMDAASGQPRVAAVSSFTPACGIRFATTCRVVSARTNWTVTAWALDGTLAAWDTQRDSDAVPQPRALSPGQAYATAVVQRTVVVPPQSLIVRATRTGGCQSTFRVEVR